ILSSQMLEGFRAMYNKVRHEMTRENDCVPYASDVLGDGVFPNKEGRMDSLASLGTGRVPDQPKLIDERQSVMDSIANRHFSEHPDVDMSRDINAVNWTRARQKQRRERVIAAASMGRRHIEGDGVRRR